MKFNIWTFLFQGINFIVLLFILKRILYRPVREIIEQRRGLVQKSIEDAEKIKKEALALKDTYQNEMEGVALLKSQMMSTLHEEIEGERKRLLSKAKEDAGEILDRERAAVAVEKKRIEGELKEKAIESVSIFTTRLLQDIASEDLHRALFARLIADLQGEHSSAFKEEAKDVAVPIAVATAYPLGEHEMRTLQNAMESLTNQKVVLDARIDKSLIAGIRITADDMVYNASLSGQIQAFAGKLREAG